MHCDDFYPNGFWRNHSWDITSVYQQHVYRYINIDAYLLQLPKRTFDSFN